MQALFCLIITLDLLVFLFFLKLHQFLTKYTVVYDDFLKTLNNIKLFITI